jgi:hypothetical protein
MVARTDIPFMMQTIPHLVKMTNFPFREIVLTIDTAPLSGDKVGRPGIGTIEELRILTQKLVDEGIVTRVIDINYDLDYQNYVYKKHFGRILKPTHNYKGYPILGSIFKIEEAKTDYILHYDSDMLLHQTSDYNWIEEGIKLMEKEPEIMFIRPLTGPPTKDGTIHQAKSFIKDSKDFYKFKFFSSRAYLLNYKRFEKFLPIPIIWRSYRNEILNVLPLGIKNNLNYFSGKGKLDSWEIMISQKLEETRYFRATLTNPNAWTLHPIDRRPEFIQALPKIIKRIEEGNYPPEQAGYYDLISQLWLEPATVLGKK